MAKKTLPPRAVLADNLKNLMKIRELSGPQVASKAGVDRKTVNNMINARFNPDLDNVEAVARVFGLAAWQLLRPGPIDDLAKAGAIDKLIDAYYVSSEAGKENILRVADMASRYEPT
jgi:transcriptional regulator with XRE-family HTH domain